MTTVEDARAHLDQYTDAETGFQYLRARYYDPGTGQFLTRDPIVDVTGQPYAYADNDPLNNLDPDGLWPRRRGSDDDDAEKANPKGGHRKGRRGSTRGKHEEGEARRGRDQGGEKGDARRTPRGGKRNKSEWTAELFKRDWIGNSSNDQLCGPRLESPSWTWYQSPSWRTSWSRPVYYS